MTANAYSIVILAAGEASRFGSAKQLALYRGTPLLQRAMNAVLAAGYRPIIMLGAHRQAILESPLLDLTGAECCEVRDWHSGLSASIRAAVRHPEVANSEGVLLLLADQPEVDSTLIERLLNEARRFPHEIIASDYNGRSGVPAVFSRAFFSALLALEGDQGARALIARSTHRTLSFPGKLGDVDTPSDLNN